MIFGILGGDFRYKFLFEMLTEEKHTVYVYKNKYIEENNVDDLDTFLKKVDILIASIPFSKDKTTVFNLNDEILNVDKLFDSMIKYKIKMFFAGVIDGEKIEYLKQNKIDVLDFFGDDNIAILNAIPTAEGAIQTAMEESYRTLFDSRCLVLGYGRCGKILASMLKGIGANVSVSYRKETDLAYIKSYGLKPLNLYNMEDYIFSYDFIFNTIPSQILDRSILEKVNKKTIIIDLAQAPGGVDYKYARDLDLKAIYCPGLPGRVAPYTAAEILKDKIIECIDKVDM